eukprot:1159016-Pelagomonas_calceolata.AAC.13
MGSLLRPPSKEEQQRGCGMTKVLYGIFMWLAQFSMLRNQTAWLKCLGFALEASFLLGAPASLGSGDTGQRRKIENARTVEQDCLTIG